MTETEWRACTDLHAMLTFLHNTGWASERKLRLCAAACCRVIWPLLTDQAARQAVVVAEHFADGQASAEEVQATVASVYDCRALPAAASMRDEDLLAALALGGTRAFGVVAALAAADGNIAVASAAATGAAIAASNATGVGAAARLAHANLLRDIVGNPFGPPPALELSWRTQRVVALALAAYDELAVEHWPLLGAALEDAGCDDAGILSHCLGPAPHARGCWVVDAILGRA
jgi:hypothetical protein